MSTWWHYEELPSGIEWVVLTDDPDDAPVALCNDEQRAREIVACRDAVSRIDAFVAAQPRRSETLRVIAGIASGALGQERAS